MATKTFSGRADEELLAYAEALTQREYGMSYGQYCASVLIEGIQKEQQLPAPLEVTRLQKRKAQAAEIIRGFSSLPHNAEIGRMSDDQLKDLIASRYE